MYSFESRIRYSETDARGRLTPEKLIDYFQDCSTFQSEDAGVGVERLRMDGLAWIIVYWRVEIHRMPHLGEKVRIGTLPYDMKGSIGLRNFLMETEAGERLADANSVWTLVDRSSMHPVRIPGYVLEKYPLEERIGMRYDSRKIRLPAGTADGDVSCREPVIVQEYHLDTNRHMNNGQYVRIAAGYLPPDREVEVLRIEYRQQAVLGDRINPLVYQGAGARDGVDGETRPERSACGSGLPDQTQDCQTVCISLNADDGKPYAVLEMQLRS